MAQPRLAKLTRPRLHHAVARERLFRRLDEARQRHPAISVVGPPGAGKTTLVASWLDAREVKGIWLQVDAGDADLATFFYYLGRAAQPFTKKGQRPMMLLTPEYLQDIEAFSRRFFRELFSRLPNGSALVLDNYQEAVSDPEFRQVIAPAVEEVPPGMVLVTLSRTSGSDASARLVANESVTLIDWEDLRFTLAETQAIAAAKTRLDAVQLHALHERSGGWAAAVTLLLERRLDSSSAAFGASKCEQLERVFDYFATQIFETEPLEVQRFLMATAHLPRMTSGTAAALSGNDNAATILHDLFRRHLFIHRQSGHDANYLYHALFREFLRHRAWSDLGEQECRRLCSSAARLLEANAQSEDAFALHCEASDWNSARELILARAETLLAQGRSHTLTQWIGMVPAGEVQLDSWLKYWLGTALLPRDLASARSSLESAFHGFAQSGDALGETLAASGVLNTYFYDYSDFRPADFWLQTLKSSLSRPPVFPSRAAELQVYCSTLIGLLFLRPSDPMVSTCLPRVEEILDADLDVNLRLTAAVFLLTYCSSCGDFALGESLLARAHTLADDLGASDINRYHWLDWLGYYRFLTADHAEAERLLQAAQDTGVRFKRPILQVHLLLTRTFIAVKRMEHGLARELIDDMNVAARSGRPVDRQFCLIGRAWLALARGDPEEAEEAARTALGIAESLGVLFWQSICVIPLGLALIESGRYEEARRNIERTRALVEGTCLLQADSLVRASEALLLLREKRHREAEPALRALFTFARKRGHGGVLDRLRAFMPELCAAALVADVETGFVHDLIRRFEWAPPAPDIEAWPYRLRIFALGGFEILVDGKPLNFARKAPRKLLLLLKATIAAGGRDVPVQLLIDWLWPDEDGAAATEAFKITLHRLRKLLGSATALRVVGSQISLDPGEVWVDAFAFERAIDSGVFSSRIEALYRGPFLHEEHDAQWVLSLRARLRGKFVRCVAREGLRLEQVDDIEAATRLYQRGIESDDLSEEFYRGLIRCHIRRDRSVDAMAVYLRLRQMLAARLGMSPSRETNALVDSIRQL